MNFELLLRKEVQEFIAAHSDADCSALALQKNPFPEIPWLDIIQQIQSKQKCAGKLPTWFGTSPLIYPVKVSVEQSSSEQTAAYKSSIIQGETLLDMTGGMGVDDFYFAQRFKQVTHCELATALSATVQHNFEVFNIKNVEFVVGDSLDYLQESPQQFDWIYLDPSRRNEAKGKVFMLEDCLPNVPENLDVLFAHSSNILLKTAPILDISSGVKSLQCVDEIHVVAVENEVKELLWILRKSAANTPRICTLNFTKNGTEHLDFDWEDKENCVLSLPLTYLYEANSAIMKSGKFSSVAAQFGVSKLHEHSHLYTHDEQVDFPGRTFKIEACVPYNKIEMKKLALSKANISTRNFPDSVEVIRKKWKIKDGGATYCFFSTDRNNQKIVLLCSKLN
ncbi:MAG: hypothetical protein RL699_827 [Bacteroidota bacterium]